jgi:hypothetical protein
VTPGQEPFQIALRALRDQLRGGVHPPGAALSIIEVARDLKLSHTPIREVLARLAGEGLIEDRRGRGYFVWRLEAGDLLDLYEAHAFHLRLATDVLATRSAPSQTLLTLDPQGVAAMAVGLRGELIFDQIVTEIGNRFILGQHRRLAERLSLVRAIEPKVMADIDQELEALSRAYLQGRWSQLRAFLDRYHQRRRDHVGRLATLSNPPPDQQKL